MLYTDRRVVVSIVRTEFNSDTGSLESTYGTTSIWYQRDPVTPAAASRYLKRLVDNGVELGEEEYLVMFVYVRDDSSITPTYTFERRFSRR